MTRTRSRFETTGTPTTVEVEVFNRRLTDDWAGIGAGINNPAPLTVHAHPAKDWEQLKNRLEGMLNRWERATLTVTVVTIDKTFSS